MAWWRQVLMVLAGLSGGVWVFSMLILQAGISQNVSFLAQHKALPPELEMLEIDLDTVPHSQEDQQDQQDQRDQQREFQRQQQREQALSNNAGEGHLREDEEEKARAVKVNGLPANGPVTIDMRDMQDTLPFANPDGGVWKQGWELSPRKGPLRVIVVPHSHCDPGWIKTFDSYFKDQVRGILSSVYRGLLKNQGRKFIWAEISYFEWWWREQDEQTRSNVRTFIKNGQLEFVTGGWVMPDEANSNIYALELQLDEGLAWLNHTFPDLANARPQYGWSIDPFGYSPTMPMLLKQRGFKGTLIQRVHYAVKKELAMKQQLEFFWRQTWDSSGHTDLFTHMMPFFSYDVPHTCGPDPSICCQFDFPRLGGRGWNKGPCPWKKQPVIITASNAKQRSNMLLDQWRKKSSLYKHNVVLVPLGDDFRYANDKDLEAQFTNYEAIFAEVNKDPGVHASFGTLGDYFRAVRAATQQLQQQQRKQANLFPVLQGSFFTYSDREQDYWSGYFTSRVFDKALSRRLESVLFAADAAGVPIEKLRKPRRELALYQHHDGITGTAKNNVVVDYAHRMVDAIQETQNQLAAQLKAPAGKSCWIMSGNGGSGPRKMWDNVGASHCKSSLQGGDVRLSVFNALDWPREWCGQSIPPKGTAVGVACGERHEYGHTDKGTRLNNSVLSFDKSSGLITQPFQEQWMVHHVRAGGAYLFFPERGGPKSYADEQLQVTGNTATSSKWSRTAVLVSDGSGDNGAIVVDLVYEFHLQKTNEEWVVRLSSPEIQNEGLFYTDLNGINFDRHRYRKDRPMQAQVYPMPALASIEDKSTRLTIVSEHSQGAASILPGTIDLWLDRRLGQDDARGLGQGVTDNVPTRTILRVVIERDAKFSEEFRPTTRCKRLWQELNHPFEVFQSTY